MYSVQCLQKKVCSVQCLYNKVCSVQCFQYVKCTAYSVCSMKCLDHSALYKPELCSTSQRFQFLIVYKMFRMRHLVVVNNVVVVSAHAENLQMLPFNPSPAND